jgi:hypothetical protein
MCCRIRVTIRTLCSAEAPPGAGSGAPSVAPPASGNGDDDDPYGMDDGDALPDAGETGTADAGPLDEDPDSAAVATDAYTEDVPDALADAGETGTAYGSPPLHGSSTGASGPSPELSLLAPSSTAASTSTELCIPSRFPAPIFLYIHSIIISARLSVPTTLPVKLPPPSPLSLLLVHVGCFSPWSTGCKTV